MRQAAHITRVQCSFFCDMMLMWLGTTKDYILDLQDLMVAQRLRALTVALTGDATKLEGAGVRGLEWEEGERSSPPASTSGRKEEDTAIPMCDSASLHSASLHAFVIVCTMENLL